MDKFNPRPLTRSELAEFLPNLRAIRAFEHLFERIPSGILESQTEIAVAYVAAVEALAKLEELSALIQGASPIPAIPPIAESLVSDVERVSLAPVLQTVDEEHPYGEFYLRNTVVTITVAAGNTAYEVNTGLTGGLTSLMDFGGSYYLSVLRSGIYLVNWAMAAKSVAPTDSIEGGFMVDGVAQDNGAGYAGATTDYFTIAGSGLVTLTPGQRVSLFVLNYDGAQNISLSHASFTLVRVS